MNGIRTILENPGDCYVITKGVWNEILYMALDKTIKKAYESDEIRMVIDCIKAEYDRMTSTVEVSSSVILWKLHDLTYRAELKGR